MAFSDQPIIDRYAENSETSERRFRDHVNLKSGYIVRREDPDYGCDLTVELAYPANSASSRVFPVQLKSVERLTIIENNTLISYSFETSRLGYLMRRLPAMGLVIIFSVEQDKCYFDFADKIYQRVMDERTTDEWKRNDSVNIHIPYSNVLDAEAAKKIHRIFTTRFDDVLIMQNSQGPKYGLPTFSETSHIQYDFKNNEHIKLFLKEFGLSLVNNYDVDMIFQMVSQIPSLEIYESKELLILAALSHSEAGLYTESQVFCNKLARKNIDHEETLMLRYLKLKNELSLGYITATEFLDGIEALKTEKVSTSNAIVLNINISKYKMLRAKPFSRLPVDLRGLVLDLFDQIDATNLPDKTKSILTLLNCENLSQLINHEESMNIWQFQLKETQGNPFTTQEKWKWINNYRKAEQWLQSKIQKVIKKATELDDKAIKAEALAVSVFHYIQTQLNVINFNIPPIGGAEEILKNHISYALTAYNYFQDLSSFKNAYDSLIYSIDLIELADQYYKITHQFNKEQLYTIKADMENKLDIAPRKLLFPDLLLKRLADDGDGKSQNSSAIKDLTDKQIQGLAQAIQTNLPLPNESMPNIENELKAMRLFYQRCTDKNIQLIPLVTPDRYLKSVLFILRNKQSGIETIPSEDMEKLLDSLGF
jgi:hypothetical protein